MEWLHLFSYLLYCVLHFCYRWIRENIIWRFNGVRDHLERIHRQDDNVDDTRTCQIFKILYRHKFTPVDLAQPSDFVCTHESFVNLKNTLVDDPRWTLYTVDEEEFVYFVEMPEPLNSYNAKRSPLLYVTQFNECTRMARVPGWIFRRYCEDSLSDPSGRVVFYTTAARSGSTLLTRVIQACDDTNDADSVFLPDENERNRIVCFSEPDVFTLIATHLQHHRTLNEDRATNLVRACLRYFCRHQPLSTTYFIKTRSNCTRLVANVKSAIPRVKHVYTFRKNAARAISSLEKLLRKSGCEEVCFLAGISPRLAFALVAIPNYEYEMCMRYGIEDCMAFSMASYVSSFYHYQQNRDLYDTPLIYFEEMIEDPERVLRSVLELCNLKYERAVGRAIKEMRFDSQGGTVISQRSLSDVPCEEFDEDRRRKLTRMFDDLDLPKVWK